LNIRENVSLAPFTSLGIGGPATFFVEAATADEVIAAVDFAIERGLPKFILGGGTNLLVSDSGFPGVVIHIGIKGIHFEEEDDRVRVRAGAGEDWDSLVHKTVRRRLAGLECMSGIPGTVGGSPVQNIGAYGQEVSETIVDVTCYDTHERELVKLTNEECSFSYRKSIFNTSDRGRYVVIGVDLELLSDGSPKVIYKDLAAHFFGRRPSLDEVRQAVLSIRRSKSMVLDPSDPNSRSAGSFFKNPIVSIERFEALKLKFPDIPSFPALDGVKIPAAWLIEQSGFHKGFRLGNAAISANHSLALVNLGGATAADIMSLKDRIQKKVSTLFSIELIPEPVLVGFDI
jgi:UDP-N-acetylmuramate dehydrogenase